MRPKQIKIHEKKDLFIKWDDGTESFIDLKYLRDECPCASCKGETILFKTFRPAELKIYSPDKYKLQNIQQVGGYAIQLTWKDKHNTGIYTWEYLKKLSEDQHSGDQQNYKPLI